MQSPTQPVATRLRGYLKRLLRHIQKGEFINNSEKIALIGNFPPRQCGIATFTADLLCALDKANPGISTFAVAMNDVATGYDYPEQVHFELSQNNLSDYRKTADFLNLQNVDVVSVQHEFGIFGGEAGSYLLTLLQELKAPVVTTLHTVLEHPDQAQRAVVRELAERSERLVVMSKLGQHFLETVYEVPRKQIDFIPHGIPDVPFTDTHFYKDAFDAEGKTIMLTFGLLSPNKGLEHTIRALPEIVATHPEVLYIILGATHPHLVEHEGESYRLSLQRLARSLGVEQHVVFYDRFVELDELLTFIGAADLYVTPYTGRDQIVSGTLAYALGAGKAIVSTPYLYAEELLADGCGQLTPFADPAALAKNVLALLNDESRRDTMRKRAYLQGRQMIWSAVAEQYNESFARARERWTGVRQAALPKPLAVRPADLPTLDLRHLLRLTDDTGIMQHAFYSVPNYDEGYTTDDNARALIAGVMLGGEADTPPDVHALSIRYLAFLNHAFNPETGRFRNFMAYDRRWLEESGSEDAHGRAIWALGTVLGGSTSSNLRGVANALLERALPATLTFTSPRAWAFTLLGLHAYLQNYTGDRLVGTVQAVLGEKLVALFGEQSSLAWPWFEPVLSYCNAKLPHALMLTGRSLGRPEWTELGLTTLQWLVQEQKNGDHVSLVGSNGFYSRGGVKASFDQQPVEAQSQVSACLGAYQLTNDPAWLREAVRAFEWFLGENDLGLPLYDPTTGGCRDGLHPDRVNQNQGSESTLAFLLSLLELRQKSIHLPYGARQGTQRVEVALAAD